LNSRATRSLILYLDTPRPFLPPPHTTSNTTSSTSKRKYRVYKHVRGRQIPISPVRVCEQEGRRIRITDLRQPSRRKNTKYSYRENVTFSFLIDHGVQPPPSILHPLSVLEVSRLRLPTIRIFYNTWPAGKIKVTR